MATEKKHFETLAAHAGFDFEETTGALMPPIFLTSTYLQSGPAEHKGFEYGRTHNPTRYVLERAIAELENGKCGFAFASGLAAIQTILELLPVNSHIIAVDDLYGGTFRLFERVKKITAGLSISYCDLTSKQQIEALIRPETKLIWVETPSNPLLKIVDLSLVAEVAKKHGLISVLDNTFATPYLQRPLDYGFDLVTHSSTKYLNGHSDVIGGVVITREEGELAERLRFLQNACGAVPSPIDCYLTFRGLKTLAIRVQRQVENAHKTVDFLKTQKKITKIFYPGLPDFPGHAIAKKQMKDFGAMISFELGTGLEGSKKFLKALTLSKLAESLGGVKTLIEHPALMTHASIPEAQRVALGISDGLIRISLGIEHYEDVIEDLKQGLAAI